MNSPKPGNLLTQAILSASNLMITSSTSGSISSRQKASRLRKSWKNRGTPAMPAGSPSNIPHTGGAPTAPANQTPEQPRAAIDHHDLQRGRLDSSGSNGKASSPLPTTIHLRYNIFLADAPKPMFRSATPDDHRARFKSTQQLAFCASLIPKDPLMSTLGSDPTEVFDLDEGDSAWLSVILEDPSAQAHIRWLLSKLVAEFVQDSSLMYSAISEVVILGPVLCRADYRTLLSFFILRFEQTPLLNVDLLRGLIQLVQSASPGFLEGDDLIRILGSLRVRLESTHIPSKEHVHQLVFAVSKVLEMMVIREVKGLNRKRVHQALLDVLRGLRGVENDEFLKFQANYAYQIHLSIPDDETFGQAFLRYVELLAVGLSAVASVFKLDPMNTLAAVEHFHQVAGNAIDVFKFNFEGARALHATAEGAAQTCERGRLVEFNQLVCVAACRWDINFQCGVCQILGEIAIDEVWDVTNRRRAIDFLGELYNVKDDRKEDAKIMKWVVSILNRIANMSSSADVSMHARSLLTDLKANRAAETEGRHPLYSCLQLPTSFPLLNRALKIPYVEYDLARIRFQRLEESRFPFFIPSRAKATFSAHDDESFPLKEKVYEFLDSNRQLFLVLGDSGSGKSTFCRQLERELWSKYEDGCRIPLFIDLASIDGPDDDLIEKLLGRHHNILADRIQEIKQHRQLVLICDGYDESRLTKNLYYTNRLGQLKVKMVISCRNTFLSHDYHGRFYPYERDLYRDKSSDLFEEATIVSFTKDDIEEFIKFYVEDPKAAGFLEDFPFPSQEECLEMLSAVPNVMNLARNPFLLTLALKALPYLPVDALSKAKLRATRLDLYCGFVKQWIQLSKERIERSSLRQEDRDVFDLLLEADFEERVMDYSKQLAEAIYLNQKGHPVVEYIHLNDSKSWKATFFGRDTKPTLLREASPLTRAGIRHWFIHQSLLDYFASLEVFDPDDNDSSDSDDSGDDDSGGGGGGDFDGGGGKLSGENGNSSGGDSGSHGGGGGSSGGGDSSSGGGSGSTDNNRDSTGDDHNSTSGGSGMSGNSGGSAGGRGGSKGDGDNPHQHKDDTRSKKKRRADKPPASSSSKLISKLNLFRHPAFLQFLVERAESDGRFKTILLTTIEHSKSSTVPSLAGANAIAILFKSGERFHNIDLDGVQVPVDYTREESIESIQLADSLTGVKLVDALLALETPVTALEAPSHSQTALIASHMAPSHISIEAKSNHRPQSPSLDPHPGVSSSPPKSQLEKRRDKFRRLFGLSDSSDRKVKTKVSN
ncbi:WD_REPEATS_REGION domain-containing protein, partial [Mortierella sp. 14UC]